MELEQFATDFHQEVLLRAGDSEIGNFKEDAFTELMIEYLSESGELDDAEVCAHRARGIKVSGYGLSLDEECLDLLVSRYSGLEPLESMPRSEVQQEMRRLIAFFGNCLKDNYYLQLPETSPVFDLAYKIHEKKKEGSISRVRFFFLTDYIANFSYLEDVDDIKIGGTLIPVSAQVWDIERVYRLWSSGRGLETIKIDFLKEFGYPIHCLTMNGENEAYSTYLALLPGKVLYRIYELYGPRLLERNVRSFLQVKGSVNQAIRKTIRECPQMFLAFNNGISATAESVEIINSAGGQGLGTVTDFQIVNGGQTTASIFHAVNKDKACIDAIFVQMKLTVLKSREEMDDVVPRISESANTQNKVQMADFSANHPFHRKLEQLSRTIWAPSATGTEKQTRWFYERARGQFADARNRVTGQAGRRDFEQQNPPQQKFTKIELAKFENTWRQLPHNVSEGAQKNFSRLMTYLKQANINVDEQYFSGLIAKAILFKQAEKLIGAQKYGGYRANIVTYTLAWMCADAEKREQMLDINSIWRTQRLAPEIEQAIITVSYHVFQKLTTSPNIGNVTEWCKKEACWKAVKELEIDLPDSYYSRLISILQSEPAKTKKAMVELNEDQKREFEGLKKIDKMVWYGILQQNRLDKSLLPEQEHLAEQLMHRKPRPEELQAVLGLVLCLRAKGWTVAG